MAQEQKASTITWAELDNLFRANQFSLLKEKIRDGDYKYHDPHDDGDTLLSSAIYYGAWEIMKLLLQQGPTRINSGREENVPIDRVPGQLQ